MATLINVDYVFMSKVTGYINILPSDLKLRGEIGHLTFSTHGRKQDGHIFDLKGNSRQKHMHP